MLAGCFLLGHSIHGVSQEVSTAGALIELLIIDAEGLGAPVSEAAQPSASTGPENDCVPHQWHKCDKENGCVGPVC